jgi:hypothetical protein
MVIVNDDMPYTPAGVDGIADERAAKPVTTPVELTVAAAALFVDHVTVCPVIVLPI